MRPIKALILLGLAVGFACSGFNVFDQEWPSRSIRLVVPYPPGGSTTVLARLVSEQLREAWGQQVIVDARGGGNTVVGTENVAKSLPDGYTLLMFNDANTIFPSSRQSTLRPDQGLCADLNDRHH